MATNPFDAPVIAFLQQALTGHTSSIEKLEVMARAAGLLGENQRITNAKLFKRAKKSLGISSLRGWIWSSRSVGGGNCHDRAKAPSKPGRENVAVPFQSIGSRGSPVSTLIVRPMTSLGTVAGSSWTTIQKGDLRSQIRARCIIRTRSPTAATGRLAGQLAMHLW